MAKVLASSVKSTPDEAAFVGKILCCAAFPTNTEQQKLLKGPRNADPFVWPPTPYRFGFLLCPRRKNRLSSFLRPGRGTSLMSLTSFAPPALRSSTTLRL